MKSSRSDPQFIDLTDTEVEVARTGAKRRSRKNYVVYLVTNALSQPDVHPLGNPFVAVGKSSFRVEEGGARVYFKLLKKRVNLHKQRCNSGRLLETYKDLSSHISLNCSTG